jgi:RAT1-interacting protein
MVRAGQPVPGQFNAGGQPVMRERSVWEAKDTLGFGDQILSFIRDVVSKHTASSPPADDVKGKIEHAVFRVTFHAPFEHVEIRALSQSEVHDEVQDKRQSGDRVGFLPRRFYEFVLARARARHSEEE